jgi:hypothetical protein
MTGTVYKYAEKEAICRVHGKALVLNPRLTKADFLSWYNHEGETGNSILKPHRKLETSTFSNLITGWRVS